MRTSALRRPAGAARAAQAGRSDAKVDLHAHTTASDGLLDPAALVAEAQARGLSTLAITDHDSVAGVGPALAAASELRLSLIPGIELNTDAGGEEIHVLGYFIDPAQPDLLAFLAEQQAARDCRAQEMVLRLQQAGLHIHYEQVLKQAGNGAVGRPHVARALAVAGLVRTPQEAFLHWIGVGMPAYVARNRLTPQAAVERIRAAGGVAALAHPANLHDLESWVRQLADANLGGLECYYKGYIRSIVVALLSLAHRFGLVPTGGSDYHGPAHAGRPLLGSVWLPPATPELLRQRALGRAVAG